MLDLVEPDIIFHGYKVATMAPSVHRPYGLLEDHSIGVLGDSIAWLAPTNQVPEFSQSTKQVRGTGQVITPGLIDCHTHIVYGGDRAKEWESRLSGVTYEEIARAGGGILSSVRSTRKATVEDLVETAAGRLQRIMQEGVTTIEIKSGYGLDLETELKMLRAARKLAQHHSVTVEATLLAAHAIPPEYKGKADTYIDLVCNEIIPAAKDDCSAVDVFCESIAFDVGQTERVFKAAIDHGLQIKVHGEQLTHTGISSIAARMGALSADHLEYLKEEDCQVMAEQNTVATVLPGAFYCLNETQKPPIECLRKYDVPIAIATDCNPGSSPVTSLLLMANMACTFFGMTAEEAIAGITINAAKALGLDEQIGSVQAGRKADFVIWNVAEPAQIIYGVGHNPCGKVIRNGICIS